MIRSITSLFLVLLVCCTLQGNSASLIFNIVNTRIVTRFSKIQIMEIRTITVPMSVWSRHHWKRKLNNCVYFNDRWKDTYNWIRQLNNQNRSYYKICEKELEIGRGGDRDVKTQMKTASHGSRMREASTCKSIQFTCLPSKHQHSVENSSCWVTVCISH